MSLDAAPKQAPKNERKEGLHDLNQFLYCACFQTSFGMDAVEAYTHWQGSPSESLHSFTKSAPSSAKQLTLRGLNRTRSCTPAHVVARCCKVPSCFNIFQHICAMVKTWYVIHIGSPNIDPYASPESRRGRFCSNPLAWHPESHGPKQLTLFDNMINDSFISDKG